MIGLLLDHNIEFHGQLIWAQFDSAAWRSISIDAVWTLLQVGLPIDASDRAIWLYCQQERRLLVTANRNKRGADSLQAVIEELGGPLSLPVLTLSNPDRLIADSIYRELCAYRIAEIALDLERCLGTARLFVP